MRAVVEIAVFLDGFRNVDLFAQGLYMSMISHSKILFRPNFKSQGGKKKKKTLNFTQVLRQVPCLLGADADEGDSLHVEQGYSFFFRPIDMK